jgi:hypothetical protein
MRSERRRPVVTVLVAAALAVAAGAACASAQTMLEPGRVEVSVRGAGPAPDPFAMRRVILAAAHERGWVPTHDEPGLLTLQVMSKEHVATIDIVYDGGGFQIRYRDSVQLDHAVEDGRTVIHPRYNKWINELSNEIRRGARDAVPQRRHGASAPVDAAASGAGP